MSTSAWRVREGTTVDGLYTILRARIIDGHYAPQQRLSQEELADELQVSRTPLREALRRLQSDGFIVSNANRGMSVAPIENSDTEQHYALRLMVEPPTLASLLDRFDDAAFAHMRRALDEMSGSAHRAPGLQESHRQFHDVALTLYPATIAAMTRSLHAMIYRHQRVYFARPYAPDDVVCVDAQLLAAMLTRDPVSVRELLEFHLIDLALGLLLDHDPGHRLDTLVRTLRGLGIELDNVDGQVQRPVRASWPAHRGAPMPDLATTNLIFAGYRS
ncbi:GntR family transcriptional regulator [Rhodococcus koreensis]